MRIRDFSGSVFSPSTAMVVTTSVFGSFGSNGSGYPRHTSNVTVSPGNIDWNTLTISWCVNPSTHVSFTYTKMSPVCSLPSNQAGPFATIDLICRNSSMLSSPPTIVKPKPRDDFSNVVLMRSPRSSDGFLVKKFGFNCVCGSVWESFDRFFWSSSLEAYGIFDRKLMDVSS